MKPKTLIDTCAAISAVLDATTLSVTQFYIWSLITARLARRQQADTSTLFRSLPHMDPKLLSGRVCRLVDDGYFISHPRGGSQRNGRVLKATDKTRDLLQQLQQATGATLHPTHS